MFFISSLRPLIVASLISLAVILIAYGLRRLFGPPERTPEQVIREQETERS